MSTTDLGLGELFDSALGDEIELVGALVVAAASCDGRMRPSDLDAALGVVPCAVDTCAVGTCAVDTGAEVPRAVAFCAA